MGSEVEIKALESREIPLEELVVDPCNVRQEVGDVSDIVASITQTGFITHLIVRRLKDGKYGVVCGSRRLHAARVLNMKAVPCHVYEMSDKAALLMSLSDNEAVKTLSEQERAEAYRRLVEEFGSIRKVAAMLGKSPEYVSNVLERHEAVTRAEREGLMVVDMRKQRSSQDGFGGKTRVGKTLLQKIHRGIKRIQRHESKGEVEPGHGGQAATPSLPLEEAVKKATEWSPKLFKAVEKGPYLHETLKRPELKIYIPETFTPEYMSPDATAPFKGIYPVYRLDPPFDNITALLCPNCFKPLRSVGEIGNPVVCLDCGFPSHKVWRKLEE